MTQTNGHVDPAAWADTVSFAGWPRAEVETFLQTIGRFVASQTKPLREEINALKAKVAQLEEGGFKYAGVYQRAVGYDKGTVVTFDGSMFVAIKDVAPTQAPCTCDAWQLCVKAGRDARDQRLPTKGGPRPETTVQRRP